ncbi:hypothetical protein C0581_05340, partial [Candidatus Parcubacteria bacterium]
MYYLKAFINSFYNIEWLRKQKTEGKKSANYIILFVLLFSVIYAGYFANRIPEELVQVRDEVFEQVPDFTVDLVDGKLQVSDLEQPFVFENSIEGESFNLIVDTVNTTTLSVDEVMGDKSVSTVFINQTQIVLHDASVGKTTIQQLSDFPNISTSKQEILNWSDDFLSKKTTFFVFLLIAWFIIFTLTKVVYPLLLSLVVFIIAHFAKHEEWKFAEIYTVSLYVITAPTVLVALASLAGFYPPFLYTILTFIGLFIVVFYKKESVVSEVVKADESD